VARKPDAIVQLNLRFPEALRRRIEYAAQKNLRSMNTEIVHRMAQSFERDAWFSRLMDHALAGSDGRCSPEEALKRIMNQLTTPWPATSLQGDMS
jgi:hypothetical protein